MTPELKQACELVFQEHKTSRLPIDWNKGAFNGRISFHLSALAKQTLENKNIICVISNRKKAFTILNPQAANADNFEEAGQLLQNKVLSTVNKTEDNRDRFITPSISTFINTSGKKPKEMSKRSARITVSPKGWMKIIFYYFLWPVFAAIAGGLITYLLGLLI